MMRREFAKKSKEEQERLLKILEDEPPSKKTE